MTYCRHRILLAVALAASLLSPGLARENKAPATERLAAYVEAFNSGSPEKMREFFEAHYADSALVETSLETRLARYPTSRARLGPLAIEKILAERTDETFALARAEKDGSLLLRAKVEKEAPHKLLYVFVEMVDNPRNIVLPDPKPNQAAFTAAVRAFLEGEARADRFSGAVLVARGNEVLFHEAYGYADRERKIPNRKDTKFNLGSINKSFTRAAVLQLAKQGRLSLEDPIGKYLPDYPNAEAARKVTIRHLLDMTSGIGDFFGPRYDATPKEKIRTIADYLPLFADRPLEFEPGTNSRYSNGGFIVLGAIIEKVSGTDYYAYVKKDIFGPCGMTDTDSFESRKGVSNLALGYTREGGPAGALVVNNATLPMRGSSAGGGYSTAGDMLKYVLALSEGKIFLPEIGNGMAIAGGAPGINASVEWDPRTGYVVIVLTNLDPPAAVQTGRRIVSWLPE
jgi:D-alanyl-D-alanine carboxypeptidase